MKDQICYLCNATLGDESHAIFECEQLKEIREKFLKAYKYYKKIHMLSNSNNDLILRVGKNCFVIEIICFTL